MCIHAYMPVQVHVLHGALVALWTMMSLVGREPSDDLCSLLRDNTVLLFAFRTSRTLIKHVCMGRFLRPLRRCPPRARTGARGRAWRWCCPRSGAGLSAHGNAFHTGMTIISPPLKRLAQPRAVKLRCRRPASASPAGSPGVCCSASDCWRPALFCIFMFIISIY